MTDHFEETISKFLRPMEELNGEIPNEAYFLTKDNLFVFVEGYCHPQGKIHGKIIYYPDSQGRYDYYGRAYASSFKGVENGELVLFDHGIQREVQYKVIPSLKPTSQMPVHAEYRVEFDIKDFRGYFDHRHSLGLMMEMYPEIDQKVRLLSESFGISMERLGATGSLSFGIFDEEDDLDLVFYGTLAENVELLKKIREHTQVPENQVMEFGKIWPIRFFLQGTLICPFFCYTDRNEVPVKDFAIEVIRENAVLRGKISDDLHSIYFPVFLKMDNPLLDGQQVPQMPVLIYDSSLRGEYFNGDELEIKGRLVDIKMNNETMRAFLCTISTDITEL